MCIWSEIRHQLYCPCKLYSQYSFEAGYCVSDGSFELKETLSNNKRSQRGKFDLGRAEDLAFALSTEKSFVCKCLVEC